MSMHAYDLLILGAGTAGMAAAIAAAKRDLRVAVVEGSDRVGGTLHYSSGQMSAAGTRLQRARGIVDTPDDHYADILRISRGTATMPLVRRAVDLAPGTIDLLMEWGFEMDAACPAVLHLHEAYRVARTYWGVDGGRSILKAILPPFEAATGSGRVASMLRHRARKFLRTGDGAVEGARVERGDGTILDISARAVVLATGGYGANPALFARLHRGMPLFTTASPTSLGDGIAMAEKLGAVPRRGEYWKPAMAGIEDPPGSGRVVWAEVPVLTPQARAPWEIFVDAGGRRFVAEDHDSVDTREAALARLPGLAFWIVFDGAIQSEAPPLFPRWNRARLDEAFRVHPDFRRAADLSALAALTGVDPAALAATIADYNRAVATGTDVLGRRHLPRPIAVPPFFAIRARGMVLRTAAGLAIDTELRVLDGAGRPIRGLYAAGEIIGGGTLSGDGYVGGMSVTPALGFGRWLGETLAA
jgi:fumarate reductase flavoprotein subunit